MFERPDKLLARLLGRSNTTSHGASAVVTGAGSGIGAAFAVELGRRGSAVVCSDIDEAAAQQTVDAIAEQGAKAIATRCDVSQIDDVRALAERSQGWFGAPPTLVINNAGVGAGGQDIGDMSLDDWAWTLGVNLWGPIHGCHVFTPILRDAGPYPSHPTEGESGGHRDGSHARQDQGSPVGAGRY